MHTCVRVHMSTETVLQEDDTPPQANGMEVTMVLIMITANIYPMLSVPGTILNPKLY